MGPEAGHNALSLFQCFVYVPTTVIKKEPEMNLTWTEIGGSAVRVEHPQAHSQSHLLTGARAGSAFEESLPLSVTTFTDENTSHLFTVFFIILGQVWSNPDEPSSLN